MEAASSAVKRTDYGRDVLAGDWRKRAVVPELPANIGEVVEDAESSFTGEIVAVTKDAVTLLGRGDRRRAFPLLPRAFLIDGQRGHAGPDGRVARRPGPGAPPLARSQHLPARRGWRKRAGSSWRESTTSSWWSACGGTTCAPRAS